LLLLALGEISGKRYGSLLRKAKLGKKIGDGKNKIPNKLFDRKI